MSGFRDELQREMIEALFRVGMKAGEESGHGLMPDGRKPAILDSRAVTEVCLEVIAFAVHTSDAVATPAKTREFCGEVASMLHRQISAIKRSPAAAGTIADTIHVRNTH